MNFNSRFAFILAIFIFFIALCAFRGRSSFSSLEGYKATMHFCVWAPTQADADEVAAQLNKFYKKILSELRFAAMAKKKPEVYVFGNYKEYVDNTSALGYNTTHTGGIAVPRTTKDPARVYFFKSERLLTVLRHELTHVIFHETVEGLNTRTRIPLWIDEGFAVYEEEGMRYDERARGAVNKNRAIPVSELVGYTAYPTDRDKNTLFYAQSASLVDFLINTYGASKFLAFTRKMARGGKDASSALFSTYYPHIKDVSQLSEAWLNFLKSK